MSLTPIEMFNMFVDNHAGDHQAFTGWLGEYMGYPGEGVHLMTLPVTESTRGY